MTLNVERIAPRTAAAAQFLATRKRRMLIGADWVDAASGRTIDAINPATGELLATFPEGAKEDADHAVRAARAAFEGPWREMLPAARAKLLWKLAELIDANIEELSELETLDQGKPIWVGRYAEIPGSAE